MQRDHIGPPRNHHGLVGLERPGIQTGMMKSFNLKASVVLFTNVVVNVILGRFAYARYQIKGEAVVDLLREL